MWRILHMFQDILEFIVERKKKNCWGKTVLKIWSQMLTKNSPKVHKTTFRRKCKTQKIKTKNNKNFYNLWRILGTKLLLLVDFWDQIFKTVFPKFFLLFSTLNSKMSRNMRKMRQKVRNGQNSPNESPNFSNYFFQSSLTYNLSHFSTSLRQDYQNSFF